MNIFEMYFYAIFFAIGLLSSAWWLYDHAWNLGAKTYARIKAKQVLVKKLSPEEIRALREYVADLGPSPSFEEAYKAKREEMEKLKKASFKDQEPTCLPKIPQKTKKYPHARCKLQTPINNLLTG